MMTYLKKNLNLNSALLLALLGLLKWEATRLYNKIDAMETSQIDLIQRVSRLEGAAGLTIPVKSPKDKP